MFVMVKVILFDLGNVMISYRPNEYFRYLSKATGTPFQKVLKLLNNPGKRMELGSMHASQFDNAVSSKFGSEVMDWATYFARHAHVKPEVMRFAKELGRKGYVIGCLSNVDKPSYDYMMKNLDLSVFKRKFASFKIGARKPDMRIYRYAIRKLKVKPSEIVFLDDMKANVIGARKAGIKAVHFTNLKDARKKVYSYLC